jgi:Bardet-Biedl syndrome 9 protein
LADFFATIDTHFERRKRVQELAEGLEKRSHQFRLIQKRLLLRFKERNPSPLCQLDTVMHGTYSQLIELANLHDQAQTELRTAASKLSCATHLMLMLIRYR